MLLTAQLEVEMVVYLGVGIAEDRFDALPIHAVSLRDGRSCNIYVTGEPLEGNSFSHLLAYLRDRREAGADPTNPTVIGAQATVRWNFVVKAMDAAVQAGFKNVQFAVSLGGSGQLSP